MSSKFQIDYDAVGTMGNNISGSGTNFGEVIGRLEADTQGILVVWKGEDANAFEQSYNRLHGLLVRAAANMEGAGKDLTSTSEAVQQTVAENKGTINKTMIDL
jgi:WXG100 family type VII secretion target